MKRVLVLALLAAAPAYAQAPDSTYVVEAGDSCLGIAVRILGDRGALAALHELNPQLGPLPHVLVPGSVLNLPPRANDPDARLSRATGDVKTRKPSAATWNPAQRGMDLFRAWRIGAAEAAAAELTFRDDSRLGMRERTIVVIYGPEKRATKVITATADLLEGTLEARLGELDGKPVVVRTSAAQANLRAGETLVTILPSGPSIVANHRGKQVAVRGRSPKSKAVVVAAGMGSRVQPGKDPEAPRPLPRIPTWATPAMGWIAVAQPTAKVTITWTTIATAKTYRVAVTDAAGDSILASIVDAPARTIDLMLPPGAYKSTVSAIDADGFESAPSPALDLEVAAGSIILVGDTKPVTAPLARLAVGSSWIAPPGWTCHAGTGAPADRITLDVVGTTTIACTTPNGRAAAPVIIETTDIARTGVGAAGQGGRVAATRTVEIAAGAGASPVRARSAWSLGAFAGYAWIGLGRAAALGAPTSADAALDRGGVLGARGGWRRRTFGIEADLSFTRPAHVATDGISTVLGYRVHGVATYARGWALASVLIGAGAQSVVRANGGTERDTDLVLDYGASLAVTNGIASMRVDLRHVLVPASSGLAQGLELTAGLSFELPR